MSNNGTIAGWLAPNLAYGAAWTSSGTYSSGALYPMISFTPAAMVRFQNTLQISNYEYQCDWFRPGQVTTSSHVDTMPSITFDLGASTSVSSVTIFNRADGSQNRFSQFQLLLGNTPPPNATWGVVSGGNYSTWTMGPLTCNPPCYIQSMAILISGAASFPCTGVGRYFTVQQMGSDNIMNLCALFVAGPTAPNANGLQTASPAPLHSWAVSSSSFTDTGTAPLTALLYGSAVAVPGSGLYFPPTGSPYVCLPALTFGRHRHFVCYLGSARLIHILAAHLQFWRGQSSEQLHWRRSIQLHIPPQWDFKRCF